MYLQIPLLDYLFHQAQPSILSDLRHLNQWEKSRLLHVLERTPAEAASEEEWADAVTYLTGAPPQGGPAAARSELIARLSACAGEAAD